MPATDTTDFEREFSDLVAELRALPTAAPAPLRERVRALGEPAEPVGVWDRARAISWRRSLLVLAPACAVGVLAAAVIHGVANSGPQQQAASKVISREGVPDSLIPPVLGAAGDRRAGAQLPGPNPNRYQDYEAWMRVRVSDLDALSDQTNEAMRIVRSYGGYVASVEEASAGGGGQADLVLRVPVAHVEEALVRLTQLGTVVERHMSIRDLEQVVAQQRARMLKLKVFIARATETLKGDLPADVRLRLQLQLEEAKRNLARATAANKATLREASLSRISLTLTTPKAVAGATKGGMGRVERAARDAASFLAAAGAVVLFLLIVLSPLLVLAAAALWGTRAYRRREERRLLART
jgi:Domain of unknown function (DUF4349)